MKMRGSDKDKLVPQKTNEEKSAAFWKDDSGLVIDDEEKTVPTTLGFEKILILIEYD